MLDILSTRTAVNQEPMLNVEKFPMSSNAGTSTPGADIPAIDVDSIIERLLEVRGSRPGKNVQLTENEIKGLCYKAREVFLSQPNLLELEAPIKVCGDMYACLHILVFPNPL